MKYDDEKEYCGFKYVMKNDNVWRVCYPGGWKVYPKISQYPKEGDIRNFIDSIIENSKGD